MRLAQVLSYIFHPVFTAYGGFILCNELLIQHYHVPTSPVFISVYGLLAVLTVCFPLGTVFFLKRNKQLDDYTMPEVEQRKTPLFFMLMYYAMNYYLIRQLHVFNPSLVAYNMGIIAALTGALVLLNQNIKISLHALGLGGVVGLVLALALRFDLNLFVPLCCLILLTGIITTVRLILQAHTHNQVYAGVLLGSVSVFCCVNFQLFV